MFALIVHVVTQPSSLFRATVLTVMHGSFDIIMSGKFVLVTGGTGFIGRHTVKSLLENVLQFNLNLTIRAQLSELSSAPPKKARH